MSVPHPQGGKGVKTTIISELNTVADLSCIFLFTCKGKLLEEKISCCVAVGDKMNPLEEYILFLHFLRSLLVVSKGRVFYLLFHVSESLDHLKKNYMSKTTKLIIA